MTNSIDERMENIRADLAARMGKEHNADKRRLYDELRAFAEAIQEHSRSLDVLRREIDEIRHVMGVH